MKCVVCKHGETKDGKATVTLEREGATFVFRGVPAQVCSNCGESYVSEETGANLLEKAESAIRDGVRIDVREFKAA